MPKSPRAMTVDGWGRPYSISSNGKTKELHALLNRFVSSIEPVASTRECVEVRNLATT
jgi:hypothetical protein